MRTSGRSSDVATHHPIRFWTLTLVVSLANALSAGETAGPSRLAVIQQAPDFTLTDQNGKTVRSSDLKDSICLVSFVFTTCNGTCPATTHRMGQVQQALKEHGWSKD